VPTIGFPDSLSQAEAAELKAHHLACSQLVRGCQDAILKLRDDAAHSDTVSYRAVEIMEAVLDSWCETLSILRSAMGQTPSLQATGGMYATTAGETTSSDSARTLARFARSVFGNAYEREHASS
jgi:hypothetical protein